MNAYQSDYISKLLFRANEDISVMNSLIESGPEFYTSTICFHAQQASEKFLKAFLAFHDVDFPRTHDIDVLLKESRKIQADEFNIDVKSMTDFGVSVRYADDFYIPDLNETLAYRDIALEIKDTVEKLIIK
jgi:HEPN domain-containing protein